MAWTVYYETGSSRRGTKKFHHVRYATKASATAFARKKSRRISYVIVLNARGREVVECHRGQCGVGRK